MGVVVAAVLIISISTRAVTVSVELKAVYKGESIENVSLMFNVYQGTEFIEPILKVLDENNVKTTFFVGGSWVAQNEQVFKRIYLAGHEIGNHGYYHKDHQKITEQRNREEIEITHKLVKSIIGYDMNLFAPPSGSYNNTTLKAAASLDYKTIMWTNDTIDWRDKDRTKIYNRAVKNLSGGTLILMHPTKATLEALPDIISAVKAKGLNAAAVSKALGNIAV
jgi:peptidoglycan/xylan/chitin deacetylase (PgdA/CDA1 family)